MTPLLLALQTATQEAVTAVQQVGQGVSASANEVSNKPDLFAFIFSPILLMYSQRYLKEFRLYQWFVKSLPGADKWAHRVVAAIGSFIVAIGINVTIKGDATSGWQVGAQIPALVVLAHGVFDWFKVFLMQQFAYDIAKDKLSTAVVAGTVVMAPAPGGTTVTTASTITTEQTKKP